MSVAATMNLSTAMSEKAPPAPLLAAYAFFLAGVAGLYHLVMGSEDALSSVLTVAEMLQCLALLLLAAQVLTSGSVAGISARAIGLEALALCCRLSSTLWLNGYLPVDESGDWFYQGVDLCALAASAWLLHQVLVVRRSSYQKDSDTFPVMPVVVIGFVLAAVFHADMNLRPVFDTMWMAGLFIGSVAVLPQLWLIMRTGGHVEALMSHFIAVMAISRALSGWFMYIARNDIACKYYIDGLNHSILAILGAHLLHLLLLGDFGYVYLKAIATQGLHCSLQIDNTCNYV